MHGSAPARARPLTALFPASSRLSNAGRPSGGYALLGEIDEALTLLTLAVNFGFINYPFLAEHDPFLEPIRRDPRGRALLQQVKQSWEHFEA